MPSVNGLGSSQSQAQAAQSANSSSQAQGAQSEASTTTSSKKTRTSSRSLKQAARQEARQAVQAAKIDSVSLMSSTRSTNQVVTASNQKSDAVTTNLSRPDVISEARAAIQASTNPKGISSTVVKTDTNIRVTITSENPGGVGSANLTVGGNTNPFSSVNSQGKISYSPSQLQGAAKVASLDAPVISPQPVAEPFSASASANKTSSGLGTGLYPEPKSNSNGLGTLPPLGEENNGLGSNNGNGNGNGAGTGPGNGLGLENGNGKKAPVSSQAAKSANAAAKNQGQVNGQGPKTEKEKGPAFAPPGQMEKYEQLRSELMKLQDKFDNLRGLSESELLNHDPASIRRTPLP